MSGYLRRGTSPRERRTLLRGAGHIAWKTLRAILLAFAAMGPSVPPPPPPPPQTVEVRVEDSAAEEDT